MKNSGKNPGKKLRPEYVRREVHLHNGLKGSVAMARQAMRAIAYAPTVNFTAHMLAGQIYAQLTELASELETRIDPPKAFQEEPKE